MWRQFDGDKIAVDAFGKRRGELLRLEKMEPVVGLEPTTVRLQIYLYRAVFNFQTCARFVQFPRVK